MKGTIYEAMFVPLRYMPRFVIPVPAALPLTGLTIPPASLDIAPIDKSRRPVWLKTMPSTSS